MQEQRLTSQRPDAHYEHARHENGMISQHDITSMDKKRTARYVKASKYAASIMTMGVLFSPPEAEDQTKGHEGCDGGRRGRKT